MEKNPKDDYVPILKTKKDITNEVLDTVNQERSGKQLGLITRFPGLNICLGKYFRFRQVTLIAGPSGHGKSALLNMILNDFLDKELNKNFKEEVVIIHNSFEMLPKDEVIRTVSSKIGKSHLEILSAEWDKEKRSYNTISDAEVERIKSAMVEDEDKAHYYFEDPTNLSGLMRNITYALEYYKEVNPTKPVPRPVVALDHSLLLNPENNENTLDLMGRLGKLAIFLKKKGCMVIIIGQFNGEIEKPERIKNPDMHFPVKSDIYAQAQLYNACDNVLTITQPELLGIMVYSRRKLSTALMVHLQVLKQRFGKVGNVWLKNAFERGQLIPYTPKEG